MPSCLATVDPAKQDGVVYRIPCECGKVYVGETGRPMQDRIKEHDWDIRLSLCRDLCWFRACPQHWTQATLEQSKVYWSWPLLLHVQGQRGNSYKTSP